MSTVAGVARMFEKIGEVVSFKREKRVGVQGRLKDQIALLRLVVSVPRVDVESVVSNGAI